VLLDVSRGTVLSLGEKRCSAPCTVRLAPGRYSLARERYQGESTVTELREDVTIAAPTIVGVRGPSSAHLAGAIVGGVGAALALTALIVPLVVCRSSTERGPLGETYPSKDPCDDLSTGAKVGWIAGGGIGLTMGLVGGLLFCTTSGSPRVTQEPWRDPPSTSKGAPNGPSVRVTILPSGAFVVGSF